MDVIIQPPSLPVRPRGGHKGSFGRVLVVGGSFGMIGAPALAATAALKMGAGLVQIAVPREILLACLTITPELIGIGLDDKDDQQNLMDAAQAADAVVIGPGLGTTESARRKVLQMVQLPSKSLVVDADALNILSMEPAWPKKFGGYGVLTPHPGEMKRLVKFIGRDAVPTDTQGRIEIAAALAIHTSQAVVLKGEQTVVTDGQRVYINHTGDSSLSKAGSGDVLSGMIASLIAQGVDRFGAAVTGVYLHGLAGQLAGRAMGRRSVLARDVIDAIAEAINWSE